LDRLARLCVEGIQPDRERCRAYVERSYAAATALVPLVGHEAAAALVQEARTAGRPLREVAIDSGNVTAQQWDEVTSPERVNALGTAAPRRSR